MIKSVKLIKKHFSKKSVKSKVGATLVELVAVVCILAITSMTCVSGMFAMADVAKRGQELSYCERTSDMIAKQLSIYGNTSSYVEAYSSKPAAAGYNATTNPDGFMDYDGNASTSDPLAFGDKNDYFLYADPNVEYRLILAKFDSTTSPYSYKQVLAIDNVKSIKFDLKQLNTDEKKYILQYTVTTVGKTIWDKATSKRIEYTMSSGVVLNNTDNLHTVPEFTGEEIVMKSPSTPAGTKCIRIRTTSRQGIDIS